MVSQRVYLQASAKLLRSRLIHANRSFPGNNSTLTLSRLWIQLCLVAVLPAGAAATTLTSVTDPSTDWNVVPVVSTDPANDQQTGQGDQDIVGITSDADFFTGMDSSGDLFFRVRLGAVDKSGYSNLFWVGIDANGDGAIDLFIGIDNSGSKSFIGFFAPGTGLNDSPSTTSIGNASSQYEITETSSNFNYQAVNSTIDPGLVNSDLNADGNTDAYLSFEVPYYGASGTASLQGALEEIAGISITGSSLFSYVIATSTQANSLNQDIGGVNGSVNSSLTYKQLGAISPQLTANGTVPVSGVPEPGSLSYLVCAPIALVLLILSGKLRLSLSK